MQTKPQSLIMAGITLLVGVLIGAGSLSVHGQSTRTAAMGNDVGRYQIVPIGTGLNPDIYFLDTKTGHCWTRSPSDGKWYPSGPSNLRQ